MKNKLLLLSFALCTSLAQAEIGSSGNSSYSNDVMNKFDFAGDPKSHFVEPSRAKRGAGFGGGFIGLVDPVRAAGGAVLDYTNTVSASSGGGGTVGLVENDFVLTPEMYRELEKLTKDIRLNPQNFNDVKTELDSKPLELTYRNQLRSYIKVAEDSDAMLLEDELGETSVVRKVESEAEETKGELYLHQDKVELEIVD